LLGAGLAGDLTTIGEPVIGKKKSDKLWCRRAGKEKKTEAQDKLNTMMIREMRIQSEHCEHRNDAQL
jgi:hypothetical protein